MPAFKVGDRVRVIDAPGFGFRNGDVGVIIRTYFDDGNELVDFERDDEENFYGYLANRFELIVPAALVAPKFKVGDRVRLIDNGILGERFPIGSLGTVMEEEHANKYGTLFIRVKYDHYEAVCNHKVSRFELVNATPRPFQVGDKVKVVKKVEQTDDIYCMWAREMEGYLNDGVEYIIDRLANGGKIAYLSAGWHFLIECLIHADGAPAVVKEHPVLKAEDFKAGDKAIIVRKVERDGLRWNPEMDKMLNDGKKYVVKSITATGKIRLDTGWLYLPDSLAIAEKKKPAPKKPKKPKLKSLRMELRNKITAKNPGGICSFAMQTKDGKQKFQMSGPCHAALSYLVDKEDEVTHLVYGLSHETKYLYPKDHKKAYDTFLKYMLNESPWAKCFLTKRVDTAHRYEVEMDVSQSRHHIAGACIALRQGSEYGSSMLPIFNLIKKKGYSGHTAFIMGAMFMPSGAEYSRKGMGGGHSALYGYMNADDLFKFFREGYHINTDGEPFSKHHGEYQVFRHIAREGVEMISTWLDKNVKMEKIGEGFQARTAITKESLFAVADKIEKLVTKGKE